MHSSLFLGIDKPNSRLAQGKMWMSFDDIDAAVVESR